MLIDWLTVIAQIVNFLVLVALLKHFLFRRLIGAMDSREKRIAGRLAEADEKSKAAQRQREAMKLYEEEQGRKRDELLAQARQQAEAVREEMIRAARDEVQRLESQWREDLDRQREALLDEVRRRAAAGMLVVIRRALADLASSNLQVCATQVFLEKLRSLDPATVKQLVGDELTVSSPTELGQDTRQKIQDILAACGAQATVRFVRAPAIAWGLELSGNGLRIGWNPDSYLETLEEDLKHTLEHRLEMVA